MTRLDHLDDDCLIQVLDRVSLDQLFKMQRLNKRMKRLAVVKMGVKIKTILTVPDSLFSSCSHINSISPDQVLVFKPPAISQFMANPNETLQLILSLLSKCSGVKSIDFSYCQLTSDVLVEAFRRCPELECVKLHQLIVYQGEWDHVLEKIGKRIVHLAIKLRTNETFEPYLTSGYFLSTVVAKCNNIKHVEWVSGFSPTNALMAKFKLLPKCCWIRFVCSRLSEGVFEDVVDELDSFTLNWSQLGHRYNRLSKLKFNRIEGSSHGVEFNGLDFFESVIDKRSISHLLACRFPLLEVFCFSAVAGYTEQDYEAVFQRITTVKKLVIIGKERIDYRYPKLPQSAIYHLKNLEIINLVIFYDEWQPELFQQVEEYVNEIGSLKKLTVDVIHRSVRKNDAWYATVEDQVKGLGLKQSRVEVVLIAKSKC